MLLNLCIMAGSIKDDLFWCCVSLNFDRIRRKYCLQNMFKQGRVLNQKFSDTYTSYATLSVLIAQFHYTLCL